MLHAWGNRFFLLWEKKILFDANIFIVPAMQHGCHAKPLLYRNRMQQSLDFLRDSGNISVFWGKYREFRRSFSFTSVVGTPAFALKEIFQIIHYSCLFSLREQPSFSLLMAWVAERRTGRLFSQGDRAYQHMWLCTRIPDGCSVRIREYYSLISFLFSFFWTSHLRRHL